MSSIREGSSVYPHAQYLIGLQYARIGQAAKARRQYKKSLKAFENVVNPPIRVDLFELFNPFLLKVRLLMNRAA